MSRYDYTLYACVCVCVCVCVCARKRERLIGGRGCIACIFVVISVCGSILCGEGVEVCWLNIPYNGCIQVCVCAHAYFSLFVAI